jgi:nicotinamidase-related amidase
MKQALLVIDIQNDYFDGGAMALYQAEEMLQQSNKLIAYGEEHNYPIYIIQHVGSENASFFIPETEGVQLHPKLNISNATAVIQKHYPNSFRDTTLQHELEQKGISELIVCGAMTHMCIDTTVRTGFDLGYNITLISDACATKDLLFEDHKVDAVDVQAAYLAALGQAFCRVINIETLIAS